MQTPNADYGHSANFSQYKTHSWLKVKAGDSLRGDRIQQDVDAQLAAKGWTKVQSNGDATVAALQSAQDQQNLQTFYDGFGGGWRWRGGGGMGMATTTDDVIPVTLARIQKSFQRSWPACSSTFPHHTENGECQRRWN
jgi:hypothetical protein